MGSVFFRKLLKILFFCLYTILILEGVTRLMLTVDPIFVRILGQDEVSGRLRWVRRHQETQAQILYEFDIYDPARGWAVKPNLKDVTAFGDQVLNTNSKGLRGSAEHDYDNPAGKLRIMLLGDSFTFGDEVSDTQTYAYYLQQLLPEAEVINLGVHGYGHDQMLIYLQAEGVKYKPDIVILGFIPDDMYRNMVAFRDYAKPKFELVGGELNLTGSPVPPPELILKQEPYRSRFLDLLLILSQKFAWKYGSKTAEMQEITAAILDELVRTIQDTGAMPVFIYLSDSSAEPVTPGEAFLSGYCQERGIHCASLRPYFVERGVIEEEIKAYGGHWNPQGNMLAAQGIRDYLLYEVLQPAPDPGVR